MVLLGQLVFEEFGGGMLGSQGRIEMIVSLLMIVMMTRWKMWRRNHCLLFRMFQ